MRPRLGLAAAWNDSRVLADPTRTLVQRREDLRAAFVAYRDQMNGKDGVLQFGTAPNYVVNRPVRIENFTADSSLSTDCRPRRLYQRRSRWGKPPQSAFAWGTRRSAPGTGRCSPCA